MRFLAPSCMPEVKEDKSVLVSWRERIYNLQPSECIDGSSVTELVSPKKNLLVKSGKWQSMLTAVCNNEFRNAILEFREMANIVNDKSNYKWLHDLSGEAQINHNLSHFVRFSTEYKSGSILKIQMAPGLERGLSTPQIQLLCLTSQLSLCLEHRRDTISCFTELASRKASKPNYKSIDEYKEVWLPVIAMEAATAAVKGQEQVFIHNVEIEWNSVSENGIEGIFILPTEFCEKRGLKMFSDYVCVRYKDLRIEPSSDVSDKIKEYVHHKEKVTFVCHCKISSVNHSIKMMDGRKTGSIMFTLKLQQCAMPFPQYLLEQTCRHTLEVIPKSLPQRRVEKAIDLLDSGNRLVKNIALGIEMKNKVKYTDIDKLMTKPNVTELNEMQLRVIKTALGQPFTLIQGPPGTGKTVTGVHLVTLFCERNRNVATQAQVLYCGPSNKSVDVVAEKLLNLKNRCPNFIRVYAERIEHTEFPLPRDIVPQKKRLLNEVSSIEGVKNRALHHLIRSEPNPFAEEIKTFDEKFRLKTDDIDDKTIDEYKSVINMAKIEELKKAEVILVTCYGSSGPLIEKHTNIKQVNAAINLVRNYGVNKKDIVILSQYRAQCATIKKLFKEKNVKDMLVLTVISSQGSEWDFVIFSTVRSQPQETIEEYPSKKWLKLNLGFITDAHQINVALTRARWGHIIIGNKHLLGCDPVWDELIKSYEDKSLVAEANTFHLTRHQQTRNTEHQKPNHQNQPSTSNTPKTLQLNLTKPQPIKSQPHTSTKPQPPKSTKSQPSKSTKPQSPK